ncbi:MAG: hypothetical protein N2506_04535 [Dehalococcoidales bacterium]|nr:hypothetical protein [Dehalococcoidales bacterium]
MGRSLSLLLRAVAVEIGGSALVREDRRRLAGAVRVGVRCATRMQDVPRASRARA